MCVSVCVCVYESVNMENSKKPPSAQDLLRRILELEECHSHIKLEISKLMLSAANHKLANCKLANCRLPSVSSSFRLVDIETPAGGFMEPLDMMLRETQYLNILQSMGQAIHMFDRNQRIIFWNCAAENMYGYTSAEVYGRSPIEILVEPKDTHVAEVMFKRALNGESWSGAFPIKNRHGERFVVVCANTPYRDEYNRVIGVMSLCSDSRHFQVMEAGMSITVPTTFICNPDSQQHLKTSIASKISNLVKLKMKTENNYTDDEGGTDVTDQSESSTPRGHIDSPPFEVFFSMDTHEHFTGRLTGDKSESKLEIYKNLSSKAKAWMGKIGISWPWKLTERNDESLDAKRGHLCWRHFNVNQEHEPDQKISYSRSANLDCKLSISNNLEVNKIEATRLWISTLHISSTSSGGGSIESNAIIKFEGEPADSVDYEILWEDLFIQEWIGEGSLGTVHHGLWYGSDVAVKLFAYQEFSDDVMVPLKQEISVMKRLRHPNVLLFMGAVTSTPHLCIVTEFLPRGSLFQILHRNKIRLDWRRRLQMTVDIARGMNYLHQCNPPIVHSDLKSSDLLVNENWSVKVGDFGLSRIKHQTYVKTKIWKGAPQWMAPEVLRNEQADEKSDVYSYGVVLWELTTEKIPWEHLNAIQVVGTVGFMNKRLEIPNDVDPQWASFIESCLCSEPQCRPSFKEILYKLEDLKMKFAAESRR